MIPRPVKKLFNRQKLPTKPGRVCVSLSSSEMTVAHLVPSDEQLPGLYYCNVLPVHPDQTADTLLTQLIETPGFSETPCSLLLLPGQYRLLLVEAPSVPDEEKIEAVRWQIRDLIDYPPEEAAIQIFNCPEPVSGKQMVFVCALPLADLQAKVAPLQRAGFCLDTVDIFELALRNLLHTFEPNEDSIGLIYLQADYAMILVCRDGELCLARQISVTLNDLSDVLADENETEEPVLSELELEIQRSLDYFQSQLRGGRLNQLVLQADLDNRFEIASHLSDQLGMRVNCLDMARLFCFQAEADYQDVGRTLATIGGAQRD